MPGGDRLGLALVGGLGQIAAGLGDLVDRVGEGPAGRLAPGLIAEAMQVGARFGYDVSAGLAGWQMISWPNQVDTLMIGMLRRRPDLLDVCTTAWCGLCLPYYLEPYYRDPYHVGDFIDVAADAAGAPDGKPKSNFVAS